MRREDYFWRHVDKTDSCWLWTGHTRLGYGLFWNGSKMVSAHRYAYEMLVGEIPAGLGLDHLCRVTECVNPAHLEPVTQLENVRRGHRARGPVTHCRRGHLFTAETTYTDNRGRRQCKACWSLRAAEKRAQLRAQGLTARGSRPVDEALWRRQNEAAA